MLIILKHGSPRGDADRVQGLAESLGCRVTVFPLDDRTAVALAGYAEPPHPGLFEALSGVELVLPQSRCLRHADRRAARGDTVIRVGAHTIGGGGLTIVAGPCAVESEEQMLGVARAVRDAGAHLLRGGAWKPRTSPYEFQGLGTPGLELLARAREATGLGVITEAVDEVSLDAVERYADVIQIGARNMQNFSLLKRAGRSRLPVLLKRGLAASLEDWLMAAEYLLDAGNPQVILCERGIRTFSNHSRYTLDLSVVPVVQRVSHLPVFVDPSHASGHRHSVAPLARAAVAVGADGVMVEVHPEPHRALCDGPQSILPEEFAALVGGLRELASLLARQRETVS